MNRREFLKLGFGATAFAAGCRSPFFDSRKPIALQLWSINKIMWKEDPAKTFDAIREIGFDGVEFAGFNNLSAKEIAKLLKDAGLRGMGAHISGEEAYTGDGLRKNLDFCAEAGIESMSNAWADFNSADEWRRFGRLMGEAADEAKKWGLPISIHNHCHEFTKVYGGVYAWDLLFSEASEALQQQIDTSQVVNPGLDVVEQLSKRRGRNFSIHMKENVPSEWGFFGVPPSDGGKMVKWQEVTAYLATEPGFSWYVIECERKPDSMKPPKYNYNFLTKLV